MKKLSCLSRNHFENRVFFLVTPHDYQPPGFKEGDCEDMVFEGEPTYLNVGEVPTPFHMLKVKVTTDRDRIEHMDQTILKQGASLPLSKEQHHDELQDQKSEVRIIVSIITFCRLKFPEVIVCLTHVFRKHHILVCVP